MYSRLRYLYCAAALASCFFYFSCENDMKKVNDMMKKKAAVDEVTKVISYMSQNGTMKAKLSAPYMLRHQADSAYIEFPRTLHVDFYNDSVKIESTVDAHYARYKEYERKVFLKDSVVVINILKKDTLKTNELWWDQNKQEFYTDKAVRIYQPDKTIYGTGLRASQNFDWYDIYNTTGQVLTNPSVLE
jgi:LPS export ABC transporter protein LptC